MLSLFVNIQTNNQTDESQQDWERTPEFLLRKKLTIITLSYAGCQEPCSKRMVARLIMMLHKQNHEDDQHS